MNWERTVDDTAENYMQALLFSAALLLIFSLWSAQLLLFAISLAFVLYYYGSKHADRHAGVGFTMRSPQKRIALFPGQETAFILEIENPSVYPLWNGKVQFSMERHVTPLKAKKLRESGEMVRYELPVSIKAKSQQQIVVPVKANVRGAGRLREVTVSFPHLFNFYKIRFSSKYFRSAELVVFPDLQIVSQDHSASHILPGSQFARISPFENSQHITGARNYVSSDPFNRIHWKASVKASELQTKMYEKEQDAACLFLLHAGQRSPAGNEYTSEQLEELLSETAFLGREAAANRQPFSFLANLRTQKTLPYTYLEEGGGIEHTKCLLVLLAIMQADASLIPVQRYLSIIDSLLTKPRTLVWIGESNQGIVRQLLKWQSLGHRVFIWEEHSIRSLGKGRRQAK